MLTGTRNQSLERAGLDSRLFHSAARSCDLLHCEFRECALYVLPLVPHTARRNTNCRNDFASSPILHCSRANLGTLGKLRRIDQPLGIEGFIFLGHWGYTSWLLRHPPILC